MENINQDTDVVFPSLKYLGWGKIVQTKEQVKAYRKMSKQNFNMPHKWLIQSR